MLKESIKKQFLKLQTRQGRKKSPFYLCEGLRCGDEALQFQYENVEAVVLAENFSDRDVLSKIEAHAQVFRGTQKEMEALAQTENPQGLILLMKKQEEKAFEGVDPFTLILDGLGEPGNVGTILRTAKAIGLKEVLLTKGTVDPLNAKAIRAGMGAQFALNIVTVDSLAALKSDSRFADKTFWLTTPHEGTACYADEFTLKDNVLVMGAEANGIEDFSVGEKVTIPMPGKSESLNVAQAATIFLFEGVRRGLMV